MEKYVKEIDRKLNLYKELEKQQKKNKSISI